MFTDVISTLNSNTCSNTIAIKIFTSSYPTVPLVSGWNFRSYLCSHVIVFYSYVNHHQLALSYSVETLPSRESELNPVFSF
jgi:hypothetical protein